MTINKIVLKILLLVAIFPLPFSCLAQPNPLDNCNVNFDKLVQLRTPSVNDVGSIDQSLVGGLSFGGPGGSQITDLSSTECGQKAQKMIDGFKQDDINNQEHLRNQACSYLTGWVEFNPGTCQAGGPPPICPANHWFYDPTKAKETYEALLKKKYDERWNAIKDAIGGCVSDYNERLKQEQEKIASEQQQDMDDYRKKRNKIFADNTKVHDQSAAHDPSPVDTQKKVSSVRIEQASGDCSGTRIFGSALNGKVTLTYSQSLVGTQDCRYSDMKGGYVLFTAYHYDVNVHITNNTGKVVGVKGSVMTSPSFLDRAHIYCTGNDCNVPDCWDNVYVVFGGCDVWSNCMPLYVTPQGYTVTGRYWTEVKDECPNVSFDAGYLTVPGPYLTVKFKFPNFGGTNFQYLPYGNDVAVHAQSDYVLFYEKQGVSVYISSVTYNGRQEAACFKVINNNSVPVVVTWGGPKWFNNGLYIDPLQGSYNQTGYSDKLQAGETKDGIYLKPGSQGGTEVYKFRPNWLYYQAPKGNWTKLSIELPDFQVLDQNAVTQNPDASSTNKGDPKGGLPQNKTSKEAVSKNNSNTSGHGAGNRQSSTSGKGAFWNESNTTAPKDQNTAKVKKPEVKSPAGNSNGHSAFWVDDKSLAKEEKVDNKNSKEHESQPAAISNTTKPNDKGALSHPEPKDNSHESVGANGTFKAPKETTVSGNNSPLTTGKNEVTATPKGISNNEKNIGTSNTEKQNTGLPTTDHSNTRERQQEQLAEKQRELEIEKQREKAEARRQELNTEKQNEKETEKLHQKEAEKQREKDAEKQHQKDAEKQREKEAEKQHEKEAEKQHEKEAEKQREREAEKQREREAEKQREREAEKQREREAEKQREREAEKQREREAERQREREREREAEREREREAARQREREAEREREREREREAEKQREREREKEREREAEKQRHK